MDVTNLEEYFEHYTADEFIDLLASDLVATEAHRGRGNGGGGGNGNGNNGGGQNNNRITVDANDALRISTSANKKAFNVWYYQFKPQWKALQLKYKLAVTQKDKEEILWEEKKLLLSTREMILNIPESLIINIAVIGGIVAVTFGLSALILREANIKDVMVNTSNAGVVHGRIPIIPTTTTSTTETFRHDEETRSTLTTVASIARHVGTAYAQLKFVTWALSASDPTLRRSQRLGGVMTKQVLIAHISGYIARIDKKLQKIMAGTIMDMDQKALAATNRFSMSVSEQLAKNLSTVGDHMGNEMDKSARSYIQGKNPQQQRQPKPQQQGGKP